MKMEKVENQNLLFFYNHVLDEELYILRGRVCQELYGDYTNSPYRDLRVYGMRKLDTLNIGKPISFLLELIAKSRKNASAIDLDQYPLISSHLIQPQHQIIVRQAMNSQFEQLRESKPGVSGSALFVYGTQLGRIIGRLDEVIAQDTQYPEYITGGILRTNSQTGLTQITMDTSQCQLQPYPYPQ
jgi:hypothetical protein